MIEQRMTYRLVKLWEQLAEGTMPAFAHFNPGRVPDLWQNCMVMVPLPRGQQGDLMLELGHVGEQIGRLLGNEILGRKLVRSALRVGNKTLIRSVEKVVETPEPVEEEGQFVSARSKVVKYRSCFLPFGTSTRGVTHVLVGLSWREF